jgi:hypothetical protein
MIANRTTPAIEEHNAFLRQLAAKWLNLPLLSQWLVGIAASIMPFFILASSVNPATLWKFAESRVIRVSNQAAVYYDDVRLVYQITSRLRELQEQAEVSTQGKSLHSAVASRPITPKEGTEANIHYIYELDFKTDLRLPSGGQSVCLFLQVLTRQFS